MTMRDIAATTKFKKDLRRMSKRGMPMSKLTAMLEQLCRDEPLPPRCHDHVLLGGDYAGNNECHIEPDWLLVYFKSPDGMTLTVARTGSHSDLF